MHRPAKSWISWVGVAISAVLVMASSSPQCSQVTDETLSPSLDLLGRSRSKCRKTCNDEYIAAKRAENARYREAKADCRGDRACRDHERAAHHDLLFELKADREACRAACEHEQGGATGGQ